MSWVQASGTIFLPSAANTALVQTTAGATVVTMAFGLGAISPLVPSGMVPSVGSSIAEATPSVTMNGVSAQILSSVYIGLGVYAITVDRPPNANSRSVRLRGRWSDWSDWACGTGRSNGRRPLPVQQERRAILRR